MNKQKLIMMTLIAAGLTACSNDDDVAHQPEKPLRKLTVEVSENPFYRNTRAAITTGSTLTSFYMSYLYDTSKTGDVSMAAKDDKGWSVIGGWPDTDEKTTVNWYAYSNGDFQANGGNPYLDFTVEENSSAQKDLLVATTSDTWAHSKGYLTFTFDHACSAMKFAIKKAKNLSDYELKVTKIVLCNVKNHGHYKYSSSSWDLQSGTANYTLYEGKAKTYEYSDYYDPLDTSGEPYLFLLPQTLTAWDGTNGGSYLKITCTLQPKSGSETIYNGDAYIPFGYTLAKGYEYDVNINIGKNSLLNGSGNKIIE